MPQTARLDAELVRRGLARSRRRASELVASGRVNVAGTPAIRPSQQICLGQAVEVLGDQDRYVSRAAHKLLGALDAIDRLSPGRLVISGRRCLDVGASTGGFSQVLLERGAASVLALDVGHGQLAPGLAADRRLAAREGVNARDLTLADVGAPMDLVVADLSFISLTLVVGALLPVTASDGSLLLMVKPQFEVGRDRLGATGVVGSAELREEAVRGVAAAAAERGAAVLGVLPSVLPGPAGNREHFLWLAPGALAGSIPDAAAAAIRRAVRDDEPTLVSQTGTRVRS
jgi:23S rRNA (cytidine1920-2'-O)/16S rRNA (cytidine1409-2'-O)-methyltransferase